MRRRRFLQLGGLGMAAGLAARWPPAVAAQPALPRLRVSDNKRFLVTSGGDPFFWLGDTAWELFHRLTRDEADRYLRRRASQRFTVIQAVALAEVDGLHVPNAAGALPLDGDDPGRPNEAYFAHVDWIVARANALGLYVGLLPTWGDKWNRKWGVGPEIFTPQNAEPYGRWIGQRYRDSGVVWILGGDRPIESARHLDVLRAMARGLRSGDDGAHLITFHPTGGQGSAAMLHDEPWLDFDMRQNGHSPDFTGRYELTLEDYRRTPAKPIVDAEPLYEGHPIAFDAAKQGHSVAADVRRPLYWDLFSGAFGHTYGHHSVWQMWTPGRQPINAPLLPWTDALDAPGAAAMQHGRALIESRPFLTREPADDVIVTDRVATSVPGAGRYRFAATRDSDRTYAMVYAPVGRRFAVRLDALRAAQVQAWWFDPRTGQARALDRFGGGGIREFEPPDPGEALDWVLVLDDVDRKYPAPGGAVWKDR